MPLPEPSWLSLVQATMKLPSAATATEPLACEPLVKLLTRTVPPIWLPSQSKR
jgi:hypothetical protein